MPANVDQALRRALAALIAERSRLNQHIAAIEAALSSNSRPTVGAALSGRRGGHRRMSAQERRAVSRRMKAYWAKRRAQASGATRKGRR